MKILYIPDGKDGGTAVLEAPKVDVPAAKPSTPAPAAVAPVTAPTPEPEVQSDDPFELPKKAAAPAAKPADKPVAAKPTVDKYAGKLPKDLRDRLEVVEKEAETFKSRASELEKKIAEYESKGKDTSALTERLNAIEKERDTALAELRATKQEASPEFVKTYDAPLKQAAAAAKSKIEQLTITDTESGTTRPATWDDFVSLYSLPEGKFIEKCDELFGKASGYVQNWRLRLQELQEKKDSALEEERTKFKERTTQEIAQRAQFEERSKKLWEDTNKRLSESVADYKDDPEDSEAAEARKHALSVFDTKVNIQDEQTYIKQVTQNAHVRQKVGAYAVTKLKLSRANEKIAAMQKQIDDLKGSAPGNTQRAGGVEEKSEEDWGAGLVKAVGG